MPAKRALSGGSAKSAKKARTPATDALVEFLRFSASELVDAAASADLLEATFTAVKSLAEALVPKVREHRLATRTCSKIEDDALCGAEATHHCAEKNCNEPLCDDHEVKCIVCDAVLCDVCAEECGQGCGEFTCASCVVSTACGFAEGCEGCMDEFDCPDCDQCRAEGLVYCKKG